MSHETSHGREGGAEEIALSGETGLRRVRALVRRHAQKAGLTPERVDDLTLAVHEVAARFLDEDTTPAVLLVRTTDEQIVCEVRADGAGSWTSAGGGKDGGDSDVSAPRPPSPPLPIPTDADETTDPVMCPDAGWRIARALCDEVTWTADRTVLRIVMNLTPETGHSEDPADPRGR